MWDRSAIGPVVQKQLHRGWCGWSQSMLVYCTLYPAIGHMGVHSPCSSCLCLFLFLYIRKSSLINNLWVEGEGYNSTSLVASEHNNAVWYENIGSEVIYITKIFMYWHAWRCLKLCSDSDYPAIILTSANSVKAWGAWMHDGRLVQKRTSSLVKRWTTRRSAWTSSSSTELYPSTATGRSRRVLTFIAHKVSAEGELLI